MNTLFRFVAAIAAGGAVFAVYQAVIYLLLRMRAPKVALAQADMAAAPNPFSRTTIKRRVTHALAVRGYRGNLAPVVLVALFVIALVAVVLNVLGITGIFAAVGAVLGSIALVWVASGVVMGRRKAAFDRQLLQAISMLVGQVESGSSVDKGLRVVANASAEPLRSEFLAADATASATRNLPAAIAQIHDRYPSRALKLFITAIVMTDKEGAAVAPALRNAANILRKDFELSSEARAEVAQSRYEYYGILAIIGFIAWMMVFGNEATSEAYRTPMGVIAIIVGVSWMGFGALRISGMLRRAERGEDSKLPTKSRRTDAADTGDAPGAPEVIR